MFYCHQFSSIDLYENTYCNINEFDVSEKKSHKSEPVILIDNNESNEPWKKVFLSYAKEDRTSL
ncbi:MAG TPA: hypothetical protein VFV86_00180 [Nitrososphaeraceae archaeon]|nr:hypothetical protein [Nitrososphaeraceae archaeon]